MVLLILDRTFRINKFLIIIEILQIKNCLFVFYLAFSGMSFHEIITFKLFFLIWHNSRHPKQKSRPKMFHPEMGMRVTRSGVKLTGMEVVRMGHSMLRRWVGSSHVRWKVGARGLGNTPRSVPTEKMCKSSRGMRTE
jgi:hypothetical protein